MFFTPCSLTPPCNEESHLQASRVSKCSVLLMISNNRIYPSAFVLVLCLGTSKHLSTETSPKTRKKCHFSWFDLVFRRL